MDRSERRERERNELEYVEDGVDPGEERYRSAHHGCKKLYERSVMRLFVDGRRVFVPSGFGGEAKTPKGARPLYRVRVDARDEEGLRDLFYGLGEVKRQKESITVEHEVDDAKARYRVVRTRRLLVVHGKGVKPKPARAKLKRVVSG